MEKSEPRSWLGEKKEDIILLLENRNTIRKCTIG
jgi:hypothetical protein